MSRGVSRERESEVNMCAAAQYVHLYYHFCVVRSLKFWRANLGFLANLGC